jgi:hypothetical protein
METEFSGGNANFRQTHFSGNVDFMLAQFSGGDANFRQAFSGGNADFFHTRFLGGDADFRSAKFSGENADFRQVQFLGGDANFRNAQFLGKADFRTVLFSGNALFWETKFNKAVYFKGTIFEKISHLRGAYINKCDREAYRIIKNEFFKVNNRIEALEYHKKEMKAYWRELFGKKKLPRKKCKIQILRLLKKSRQFFNKIIPEKLPEKGILVFNCISNNYDTNWIQGAGFTAGTAFIFYLAFLSLSNVQVLSFEGYLRFLNPAHSYEFLRQFNPCDWAYIIDAFGRVFIGYGYYQTIQAFRKYKRV